MEIQDLPAKGVPAILGADLDGLGLLEEDLNEFELVKRYDPDGINGLKPADRSHIALVRVGDGRP